MDSAVLDFIIYPQWTYVAALLEVFWIGSVLVEVWQMACSRGIVCTHVSSTRNILFGKGSVQQYLLKMVAIGSLLYYIIFFLVFTIQMVLLLVVLGFLPKDGLGCNPLFIFYVGPLSINWFTLYSSSPHIYIIYLLCRFKNSVA
jgi:hypothetical protein